MLGVALLHGPQMGTSCICSVLVCGWTYYLDLSLLAIVSNRIEAGRKNIRLLKPQQSIHYASNEPLWRQ